jgi:hypothetical protein
MTVNGIFMHPEFLGQAATRGAASVQELDPPFVGTLTDLAFARHGILPRKRAAIAEHLKA